MKMRCKEGRFMRRLTSTSNWYVCYHCKEIKNSDPERNFGLMLLGFHK